SEYFERALQRALDVPVPNALADRIILDQSMSGGSAGWTRWMSMAAALALAVALTTFGLLERGPDHAMPAVADGARPTLAELERHIAWHWEHDGPMAVNAAFEQPDESDHVQFIFSELGVQLEPELLSQVRLSKFCPTPNGDGVHAVLETDQGPVTVYFMPHTRIPTSPATIPLPNGQESLAINLERGSMALIAETGADMPELAREIVRQLTFAPGVTI
ncbi:MAG: DUF3379 family protein, partial [Wenzhouxiangellaceae bacterium]